MDSDRIPDGDFEVSMSLFLCIEQDFPLVTKLYLGTKMVAKLSLGTRKNVSHLI